MTEETAQIEGDQAAENAEATQTPDIQADTKPDTASDPAPQFDWRKEIAGDDDKIMKRLERFGSAGDFWKSYSEAENRVREGFKPPELPADATEDQIKDFRAKIGVPETAEDYKLNLPEGMAVNENDKPLWSMFLSEANSRHISQSELDKVAPAYYAMEAKLKEQQEADYKEATRANDQALREMWGSDTDVNLNINENFYQKFGGDELRELFSGAVSADGKPLANHPMIAKFHNEFARMYGFADGMVYDDSANQQSVQDEIDRIMSNRTGKNREAYYKNSAQAAKDDKRLTELYEIRERFKK